MLLEAKDLLANLKRDLLSKRNTYEAVPSLAIIWVGEDAQTSKFVEAKKKYGKDLLCEVHIHHLKSSNMDQMIALINTLNQKKSVHGIVLQLPLPENLDAEYLISLISDDKDVDNLKGEDKFVSPNPQAILSLLESNHIDPVNRQIVILGNGKLVGQPLSRLLSSRGISTDIIASHAEEQIEAIKQHDLLIAATGRNKIVGPQMVHSEMVIVDGSGVDVDLPLVEPVAKAVTPVKGAIGPLTVHYLFENLLKACQK